MKFNIFRETFENWQKYKIYLDIAAEDAFEEACALMKDLREYLLKDLF